MVERDFTRLQGEDLQDIQGVILLDYAMPMVRHFLVKITCPREARALLGVLADRHEPAGLCITSSEEWREIRQKDYCLNVGLTYAGLKALALPPTVLDSFAATPSFVAGAEACAWKVGDTGEDAPEHWWIDEQKTQPVSSDIHMLLSLYVRGGRPTLESRTADLTRLFHVKGREIVQVLYKKDGTHLDDPYPKKPGTLIHFGFKDGVSQPQIAGAPDTGPGAYDGQETVPPGAFLFGYASQWEDFRYPVPRPEQFGRNGSFAVFRVMKQDVGRFAEYLEKRAQEEKISEDQVAALLCGRARNGDPLVETRSRNINDFDYAMDPEGKACPFESHIRRTNPRGEKIAGGDARKHPIIRRGMPYGSKYRRSEPDNDERGLIGLFIGVSIEDQFEFIMQNWMHKGGFRRGLPSNSVDPLLPFIKTRGCVYCFLPSITALRYIANL